MNWDTASFTTELATVVDCYDKEQAGALTEQLIEYLRGTDDVYPENEAKRILQILRNKRFFDLMERTGDAFIQSGQDTSRIRRQFAQSLLDQGNLTSGIVQLKELVTDTADDPAENTEARGLLGRAHKQFYVDAKKSSSVRAKQHLEEGARSYYEVYRDNRENRWHGINAVALLKRADRDGVPLAGFPDPDETAGEILKAIESKHIDRKADMWDFATAAEACVALGRNDEALRWAVRYVGEEYADAFELSSTLRQLQEVWQLDQDSEPGRHLLPLLMSALLRREGARIDFIASAADIQSLQELSEDRQYQAILGTEGFTEVMWFRNAMDRARTVALIENANGKAMGSGFLVRAKDLGGRFGNEEEPLFLTNAHVISNNPDEAAVSVEQARIDFELKAGQTSKYRVKEHLWTSPKNELDATLVKLDKSVDDREPASIASALPRPGQRVYIIGHPGGRKLSFSIYDNELLSDGDPLFHYRTPTEGGSSGSPVFNKNWELIGLHHVGNAKIRLPGQDDVSLANEGTRLRRIVQRLPQ